MLVLVLCLVGFEIPLLCANIKVYQNLSRYFDYSGQLGLLFRCNCYVIIIIVIISIIIDIIIITTIIIIIIILLCNYLFIFQYCVFLILVV